MNNENNLNYLIIDSKNSFTFANYSTQSEEFSTFLDTIDSDSEEMIMNENEINKLILKIIPGNYYRNKKTYFDISKVLSVNMVKKEKDYVKTLTDAMNNILNNRFEGGEFMLNKENIHNISIVLFYSFWRIDTFSKQYYHIDTQADMASAVFEVIYKNIEVLKSFVNRSNETKVNDISQSSKVNEVLNNSSNYMDKQKIKPFLYIHNEEEQYSLPKEFIALLNKFNSIKRFSISIDVFQEDMTVGSLIILLNANFIFPNLVEVDYNLISDKISSLLNQLYSNELNKNLIKVDLSLDDIPQEQKGTNDKNNEIVNIGKNSWSYWDYLPKLPLFGKKKKYFVTKKKKKSNDSLLKDEQQDGGLEGVVQKNEMLFNMVIICSFLMCRWEKVRSLKLNFTESYSKEIQMTFKNDRIPKCNCLFLNYFFSMNKLVQFIVDFDAFDSPNFKKVIGIVLNGSKLRKFTVKLFASDDYYSSFLGLFRLCKKLDLDISNLFIKKSMLESTKLNDNIDYSMVKLMINGFARNLEYFLYAIRKSEYLNDLDITINLPSIIKEEDSYIFVLVKFLINLFIFIFNGKHSLNSVRIIAPQLSFNDRKCPLINQFLESIDVSDSDKCIKKFSIQLRLLYVINIPKLIMKNLKQLFIGDMDPETFRAFSNYYTSKEFQTSSELVSLSISLSVIILDLSCIANEFLAIYRYHPPQLCQFNLFSNIKITNDELSTIYSIINYNSVEKYIFHFLNNPNQMPSSFIQLYHTSNIIRTKLMLIYYRLIKNKSNSDSNHTRSTKVPLTIFRDYLSERKDIKFGQ